jgi:hypothetical protein
MSYCQECGSYLERDADTCSSCGNKLIDHHQTGDAQCEENMEVKSESDGINTPPSDNPDKSQDTTVISEQAVDTVKEQEQSTRAAESSTIFNPGPSEFISQEGISAGSHWNQIDSHLGRGLIKPVAIENCMDGYHFKYDEPPRQITKPEPQQENVVEFRFSGESQSNEEAEEGEGSMTTEEEQVNQEILDIGGVELDREGPKVEAEPAEPQVESEIKPERDWEDNDSIKEYQEIKAPVEEVVLPEEDPISEIDGSEPEIHVSAEPVILWEGRRTWYGLALKEEYRITDQSAMLLRDGHLLREIQWRSVSEIGLKQNWLTKFLNIGNLEIIGVNSEPLLIMEGIDHPERLQKTLVEMISPKV